MTDPTTDAEKVETARAGMQAAIDEAVRTKPEERELEAFGAGLGMATEYRRVIALDVRALGAFVLDFHRPAPVIVRTMWVFLHEKEEAVYVVGIENVMALDRQGHAMLKAFVSKGDKGE